MIKKPRGWDHLRWWESGERQAVEERLEELVHKGYVINPTLDKVYKALELVPFQDVRVCIVGQDPYPEPSNASGVAFSTGTSRIPPTLGNIFSEYVSDLHLSPPTTGVLTGWCRQGVLLWNAVPTCEAYKSLSHLGWPEWQDLTKEVIKSLSTKGIVFVFLGSVARSLCKDIRDKTYETKELKRNTKGHVSKGIVSEDLEHKLDNTIFELSHPSPRASKASKSPFLGSRMFSSINAALVSKGYQPVDWRLP